MELICEHGHAFKAHTERSGSVEMKQFEATTSKQVVDHLPVGWTVALYNSYHKRFLKITNDAVGSSGYLSNPADLSDGWTHERFLVVEGGMNDIALWNTHFQRYLKITGSGQVGASGISDKFLPGSYVDERLLAEKISWPPQQFGPRLLGISRSATGSR